MCRFCGRPRDPEGNTSGRVWPSRLIKGIGREGFQAWFLLANSSAECGGSSQEMQWLLEVRQADPFASIQAQNHTHHLAVCSLVPRHGRTIQTCTGKLDPYTGHG